MEVKRKRKSARELFREAVRERYQEELAREMEHLRPEGKFPYEGKWRSLEEIRALQLLMRKKDRTIVLDLVALYLVLLFIILLLSVFLFSF